MSKNDNETTKVSKNSGTKKKTTTTNKSKSQNKTSKTNKTNSVKKTSTKTTTNKPTKKTTTKKDVKVTNKKTNNTVKKDVNVVKTNTKNIQEDIKEVKHEPTVVEEVKLEKVNVLDFEKDNEVEKEITNNTSAKIENAKFTIRKRNKTAIAIGVFISLLGIVALIIALIANRIIDREFISDNQVIVMVVISIAIELMGAAIIIKET